MAEREGVVFEDFGVILLDVLTTNASLRYSQDVSHARTRSIFSYKSWIAMARKLKMHSTKWRIDVEC